MNPKHQEARLLRRIAHLRTILRLADEARIVVALNELIAETELRLVKSETDPSRNATCH
jgi:hypothetical protein